MFKELVGVLKIAPENDSYGIKVPAKVLSLFKKRNEARRLKQFELADKLRSEIEKLGFCVEETRKGSRLVLKRS